MASKCEIRGEAPGDLHSFAVCAYRESPFLGYCIKSVLNQPGCDFVYIATSTPNDEIFHVASEYGIEVFVRDGKPGIAEDWNFAISCAKTPFVTIAHQDDVYSPDYAERAVAALSSSKRPLLYFSDYGELRDGNFIDNPELARIKRCLLKPYSFQGLRSKRFFKRLPLAFGNPICCPSVTYALDNLPSPLFKSGFRSNLDWDAWERFSKCEGEFIYDGGYVGMYHRVHEGSETSACIVDDVRTKEDFEMLSRFWPKPVAGCINRFYSGAQKLN